MPGVIFVGTQELFCTTTMKPASRSCILFFTVMLLLHGLPAVVPAGGAELSADGFSPAPPPPLFEATAREQACNRARQWYDQGLLLSDNSLQEAYCYQQAVKLCPELVEAHHRLGRVYMARKEFELSLKAFEEARLEALANPSFAARSGTSKLYLDAIVSRGEIYRLQGRYELAVEEFKKALQFDPDALAAQNQLQYLYKRQHLYSHILSPNTDKILTGLPFSRVAALALPRNSFYLDLKYRYFKQTLELSLDMFDMNSLKILTPIPPGTEEFLSDINQSLAQDETETTVREIILGLEYGLTDNLNVGVIPKFFSRDLGVVLQGFEDRRLPRAEGFGDTELLLKYHFRGRADRNLARHLSVYTLFSLPTGSETEVVADKPLITINQENPTRPGEFVTRVLPFKRYVPLGSESLDITPGLAFALTYNPLTFLSNIQYKFTDGELIGDEFRFNAGVIYRSNPSVNATLELNYRWRGEARRRQHLILDKFQPLFVGPGGSIPTAGPVEAEIYYTEPGGHSLYLSPGLQFTVAKHVRIELAMQIPVIKEADGLREDYVYHLGVRVTGF